MEKIKTTYNIVLGIGCIEVLTQSLSFFNMTVTEDNCVTRIYN